MDVDVARDAWLGAGDWVDSPPFPGWQSIDLVVIHWPGSNGVPYVGDDPADVFDYLRGQQAYYLSSRGYNLGYNFAADWTGRRIEVRGDTYQNAANAPSGFNRRSVSLEVLTNLDGAMTAEQVDAVADLCGQVLAAAPRATIIGHRDGPKYVPGATATSCPGDPIYARITAGEFYPNGDEMTPEQYNAIMARLDAIEEQVADRQATWNAPTVGNPQHDNNPAAYLGDLWLMLDNISQRLP